MQAIIDCSIKVIHACIPSFTRNLVIGKPIVLPFESNFTVKLQFGDVSSSGMTTGPLAGNGLVTGTGMGILHSKLIDTIAPRSSE